ncbi:MAG: isoaspartyl peptidase/L-asparaginase [Saprospiraceae bacterium]|nr:isoaspartyl peptidase/L-asparaginase [Pyrinomonadaceae bacterium]
MPNKIALAIHGGAGTILRSTMTAELEAEYRSGLGNALKIGWGILSNGGNSLDAVEAAVCSLEDFHLFNAGRGSVFTHEGKNEMDASIMDGKTLKAGAVAFVKNIKNPVKLARLVMERTEHILLAGEGANHFAELMAVENATDEYFYTQHRYDQLLQAVETGKISLDHDGSEPGAGAPGFLEGEEIASRREDNTETAPAETRPVGSVSLSDKPKPIGTVGAVACDRSGDLAAATSTGGMTNKKFGRIGDTALIGSGTYAENKTCAVSCTGHGEFFMLGVTAYDVAARMKYKGLNLAQAAKEAIDYLTQICGEGGLIAVDTQGNVTLPFNSDGMYRGFIKEDSELSIEIYR